MGTTMLGPTGRARLERRPLEITVELDGQAVPIQLGVTPDVPVLRPHPALLVVRNLPDGEPVRVWIARRDGAAFAQQTSVHLTASVTMHTGERDTVTLSGADLSDLSARELVVITAAGEEFTLEAAGDDPPPPLSPRGTAAYVAARSVAAGGVHTQRYSRVRAIVDNSASMREHIEGGGVAALIDVLTGITAVLAPNTELQVEIGGVTTPTPVPARPGHLGEAVMDSLRGHTHTSGFRLPTIATSIIGGRELTYVVTDAVPPRPAGVARDGDVRLLVLGGADTERWFRAQSDLPLTLVDPNAPGGLRSGVDELDPAKLRALVASAVEES
jgi:hypothetical protein